MDAAVLRPKLSLAVRLGLGAAIALYALLALGSGADRLSAGQPDLAIKVPALFADEAIRTVGAQALAAGQAVATTQIGTRALASAPTHPQSAALFGAGRLASGDRVTADRAFRIAGQLGWRVPITQSYWMGQALAAGNYEIAALRLDALLRQQPALLRQRQLTDPMERNPAGRTALIKRMALAPVWLGYYAGDVFDLPADVLLQRAAVLDEAARRGLVVGCEAIAPIATGLAVVAQPRAGSGLWRLHCPAAGPGLVSDENLTTLDISAKPSAFTWELIGNGELSLSVLPSGDGHGQRLTIEGKADVPRAVLAQLVVLEPGRYVLSWRTGDSQGRASDHIRARLICAGETRDWLTPTLDRTAGLWRAVVQVDGRCPAQRLIFAAAPGAGRVWLEQISLIRAP